MLDVSSEEITDGKLLPALLVLAAPLLVQNLVRVLQQVIDLFWIGRYGELATAGVSLAFPAYGLLAAFSISVPFVGTQVVVSQRVGADDRAGSRRALASGAGVAIVLGVGVGALAYLSAPFVIELLSSVQRGGEAAAVREFAVEYLQVVALGLVFVTLADTLEAAFVGYGDSRASLYLNIATVLVNIVLDPVFIFGIGPVPELGVAGAALALITASGAGLVAGAALVAAGRNNGMLARGTRPALTDVREVVDIGVPTAGQQAARQLARISMVVLAFAAGGAAGLAAYFVGSRVAAVAVIPAIGLQQATQSVVGQNLGAAKPGRANRATWLGAGIAVGGLAAIGVLQWFLPGTITRLLVPSFDPVSFALSVDYLRILALGYPAIGAVFLLEGGFNGARRTRTSLVVTLLQFWMVRIPIAAAGAYLLGAGIHAVFWAVTLSNIAAAAGIAAYFRHEVSGGMLDRAVDAATGDTTGSTAPDSSKE